MNREIAQDIFDIVGSVSEALGNTLNVSSLRTIARPDGKEDVKDATLAFFVDGKARVDDIVLLLSNPVFPDTVMEDVDKASAIRELLDPEIAQHINRPQKVGTYGQQSYAVYARLDTVSDNKFIRIPQRHRVAPDIVSWSARLAAQTRISRKGTPDFAGYFIDPLQSILEDSDAPEDFRALAGQCLDFVSSADRDFFTTVEHGDFWIGNVLFERKMFSGLSPILGDFFVIDWRGARLDGYPCKDVVRFCRSLYGAESPRSGALVKSYREALGLCPFEMGLYCILSLGRLGANLEFFPRPRYYALVQETILFLRAHGCTSVD